METATIDEAAQAAARGEMIVDVRTPHEYMAGHVPGSMLMPLTTVPLRLSELPRETPIHVICESGARAFQACLFLERQGYQPINVHGGMNAWRAVGLPVERGLDSIRSETSL